MSWAAFGWLEVNLAASTFSSRTWRGKSYRYYRYLVLSWSLEIAFMHTDQVLKSSNWHWCLCRYPWGPSAKSLLAFIQWPILTQLVLQSTDKGLMFWLLTKNISSPVTTNKLLSRYASANRSFFSSTPYNLHFPFLIQGLVSWLVGWYMYVRLSVRLPIHQFVPPSFRQSVSQSLHFLISYI